MVFVLNDHMDYPPTNANIKISYITKEFQRRGRAVSWVFFGHEAGEWSEDGIDFVGIPRPEASRLRMVRMLRSTLAYCRRSKTSVVYIDDWLFLRHDPRFQLRFQQGLKALRIGCVFDQRDPYIDFQVTEGQLKVDTPEYRDLIRLYQQIARYTDLTIFPSEAYRQEMRKRELTSQNDLGAVRGVDTDLFYDSGEGEKVRKELGIGGKFVIGWFGMMLPLRRIEEVLVPMIRRARREMPDVHFLIGGRGVLETSFSRLKEEDASNITTLGFLPYGRLPACISACDLVLSPVDPRHTLVENAASHKILEAIAVGRPVIATTTRVKEMDYKGIQGIVWTGTELEDFMKAVADVRKDYPRFRREAEEQARDFELFSTKATIARIVDEIERVCK